MVQRLQEVGQELSSHRVTIFSVFSSDGAQEVFNFVCPSVDIRVSHFGKKFEFSSVNPGSHLNRYIGRFLHFQSFRATFTIPQLTCKFKWEPGLTELN